MIINEKNCNIGYSAMAAIMYMYYQMIQGGSFDGDETVYIDSMDFDAIQLLDVSIESKYNLELDEDFIRKGTIIYLLSDLNDVIIEREELFVKTETYMTFNDLYLKGKMKSIPEVSKLMKIISNGYENFNYTEYKSILDIIYQKYIVGFFKDLTSKT